MTKMTKKEFFKKYKEKLAYICDGYYRDCIDELLEQIYNDLCKKTPA
jgi:hypothetical protein